MAYFQKKTIGLTLIAFAILLLGKTVTAESVQKKHFIADDIDATVQDINALDNKACQLLEKTSNSLNNEKSKNETTLELEKEADILFGHDGYRFDNEPNTKLINHLQAYDAKIPLEIAYRDYKLNIGGSTKIENYFQNNAEMLNSRIPNESLYFKHTLDLMFNYTYGEKHFGHKAIEGNFTFMHKGYWGSNSTSAEATKLSLNNSQFSDHKHASSRPYLWFREAWLKTSINAAIFPEYADTLHFIKLGWFPFELGRGIALGSAYGNTRDAFGLYSAKEDKFAPGINISGEIIKDSISYDLYYSVFRCASNGIADTLDAIKGNQPDKVTTPWRGVNKNTEVFAARLNIKPQLEDSIGKLEFEPYIMYNEASDQSVELPADSKIQLSTAGLNFEHSYNNFEWGGEAAINFGTQYLRTLDRNVINTVVNDNGLLEQQYSKIVLHGTTTPATLTAANISAAKSLTYANRDASNGGLISSSDRFRDAYQNNLKGFMGVIDAAYTLSDYNLRFGAGAGYVSGDENQQLNQKSKDYKGFIAIHEFYTGGKRIKSLYLLDQRCLQRPTITSKAAGSVAASASVNFSDLKYLGLSTLWTPVFNHKKVRLNTNAMFFWQDHLDNKISLDKVTGAATFLDQPARNYLGTELNILSNIELLKDLNAFANFALFIPGSYFSDIRGIPMKNDAYKIVRGVLSDGAYEPNSYRLGKNTAYHFNVGLSYKF